MFTVAGVLTCIGAVSPAAVAIIAPIALSFAHKYGIRPLLMGLMVIHGAQAGGFSPMSIYGGITNQVVERAGLPGNEIALFLASLVFNFVVAVSIYFFFGAHRAARRLIERAHIRSGDRTAGLGLEFGEHDDAPAAQQCERTQMESSTSFGIPR
jgi:Na+/H+ antiporter NhaD/arsenite permease-like protein